MAKTALQKLRQPQEPGGIDEHRRRLEVEGFAVKAKGKSAFVVPDFATRLAKL